MLRGMLAEEYVVDAMYLNSRSVCPESMPKEMPRAMKVAMWKVTSVATQALIGAKGMLQERNLRGESLAGSVQAMMPTPEKDST